MIKRYLLLLGLLFIPCFSFAGQIGSTTSSINQVLGIDLVNGEAGDFVGVSWINYNSNNIFEITSQGGGNYIYNNGVSYNNLFQGAFGNGYSKGIFFWNDGKLIFHSNYSPSASWNPTYIVQKFAKVSSSEIGNFSNYSFDYSLEDVLSSGISLDHQVFAFRRGNDGSLPNSALSLISSRIIYCLGDGTTFYCASCVPGGTYDNPTCNGGVQAIDLGLTRGSTIQDINSLGLNDLSPVDLSRVPIQETIDITDQDIIDYYEENPAYKFNRDMCYIGTTDLTSNYEDRITYYQGSGYTIYEFFEQLYGNNFKLSDLDIWLNSWLVNFNTFFNGNNRYSDGTPWYVLRYNGIGNILLDKNNLDNPFLNNKSAYYFMASTIYDSYKGYDISPNSEDIAVYCYKKTNVSSDIEFDAPNGIRNNIGNWVDQKNKGIGVGFSGWSIVGSESWDGTPLDYFTGDNIVYTGFDSFFKTSFNRFAGVFQGLDPSDLVLGQIPSYIVGFLLLLILFRFLSH